MLTIEKLRNGGLRLSLPHEEGLVLCSLPSRLREVLESESFERRVVERLFPRAYADPNQEEEYRRLLGDDLRRRKLASVEAFEATLRTWRVRRRAVEILLRGPAVDLLLAFLNDMRLLLGTELDIRSNEWSLEELPRDDDRLHDFALLQYLTWIQGALLEALGWVDTPPPAGDQEDSGELA